MSPSEQAAMILLLQNLKPSVAIEIGTKLGGSLQVLARFSKKVYSLEIDPEVERRLAGKYPNVEFIIGPSTETLPPLLKRLEAEQANLGFVLVDGDHTTKGVKSDINNVLEFKPRHPLYVVMHDSFNPECRTAALYTPRRAPGRRLRSHRACACGPPPGWGPCPPAGRTGAPV